jgi:hypothetical protein
MLDLVPDLVPAPVLDPGHLLSATEAVLKQAAEDAQVADHLVSGRDLPLVMSIRDPWDPQLELTENLDRAR